MEHKTLLDALVAKLGSVTGQKVYNKIIEKTNDSNFFWGSLQSPT